MPYINLDEIDKILDDTEFSGSVHIIKNSEELYFRNMGWADIEEEYPFTDKSTIELASLSKQFTAIAIMTLVERGKLQLDNTINKFIPEYEYSKFVTIRHLLNHTSGIIDYSGEILVPKAIEQHEKAIGRKLRSSYEINEIVNPLCRAYNLNECLDLVNGRPLHFPPGETTAYSNTNYHFLSDIIERISDMSFNEYLMSNIFKVLGMNDSHADGFKADAKGYIKDGFGNTLNCDRHGMLSGDSGVVSNMKDIKCWCSVILNRSLLSQESWRQCLYIVNERFGFGFEKFNHFIGHNGGMPGISNRERLHFPSKTAIIILSNYVNTNKNTINEILQKIIK